MQAAQVALAHLPLVLRRPQVEQITGLSRSTIYDWMANGSFPQPVKLGVRAVGWRQADILGWLESRQSRRNSGAAASNAGEAA